MARRVEDIQPIHDVIDDARTDDEIVQSVSDWLESLRLATPLELDVSAADELAEARRDGDV